MRIRISISISENQQRRKLGECKWWFLQVDKFVNTLVCFSLDKWNRRLPCLPPDRWPQIDWNIIIFFTTEYLKKLFNIQHHPAVGPQSSVIVMWSIQAPFHCLLGIHYGHHPSTFIIYPHSHSLSHQIWPQYSIIYLRHVSDVWWCLEGKNCFTLFFHERIFCCNQ